MELGFRSPAAKWVGGVLMLLGGIATGVLPFLLLCLALLENPTSRHVILLVLLTVCSAALGTMPGVVVGKVIDYFSRRS
jgi:hypothetical protein